LLRFDNNKPFSTGACRFQCKPSNERETSPRILIPIEVSGQETRAVLDTGGLYFICSASFARFVGLVLSDGVGNETLNIRGTKIRGELYRIPIKLVAEEHYGCSIEFEVTAFIYEDELDYPMFLGWTSCMERIQFAIQPFTEVSGEDGGLFHFGSVDEPITV